MQPLPQSGPNELGKAILEGAEMADDTLPPGKTWQEVKEFTPSKVPGRSNWENDLMFYGIVLTLLILGIWKAKELVTRLFRPEPVDSVKLEKAAEEFAVMLVSEKTPESQRMAARKKVARVFVESVRDFIRTGVRVR